MLVPFSNRISGSGFTFQGVFHTIAPNLAGEGFPIHGDGFQRVWAIEKTSGDAGSLMLDNGEIGPFRYKARQRFRLEEGALHVEIAVTNAGSMPLPFGAGFHPWFPRFTETTLRFRASNLWLEDARHLPTELVDVAARPQWDFSDARPLPKAWINNAFTGWPGAAMVTQPSLQIAVDIEASTNLDVAIVYSPGPDADFFCFEPVSHPVDAHNLTDRPGLKMSGARAVPACCHDIAMVTFVKRFAGRSAGDLGIMSLCAMDARAFSRNSQNACMGRFESMRHAACASGHVLPEVPARP